jgi:hypothetical protein
VAESSLALVALKQGALFQKLATRRTEATGANPAWKSCLKKIPISQQHEKVHKIG